MKTLKKSFIAFTGAAVQKADEKITLNIGGTPVIADDLLELLWYVEEQSLSDAYIRYDNLRPRSDEQRNGPV